MSNGHSHRVTALFTLLIAITFLLKGIGVFDPNLADVMWPTFLGIISLVWMGKR
jgi:hypothetical protein